MDALHSVPPEWSVENLRLDRIKLDRRIMRVSLLLGLVLIEAAAQNPVVQLRNTSHPASQNFQIGDRFEILISGARNQPISVRTTRQGRTDWGPIIGWTNARGRWATTGQFEKDDFGSWSEIWTVGGKLAGPVIDFSVTAPCRAGRQGTASISGPNEAVACETTGGPQTFVTPSLSDPFRVPGGRLVPGRPAEESARQYHMQIIQDFITGGMGMNGAGLSLQSSQGGLGDEMAGLIADLIGVNALSDGEIRNTVAVLRAAFAKPEIIQPGAKEPSKTLLLLRHLADMTRQASLHREINNTITYLQAR